MLLVSHIQLSLSTNIPTAFVEVRPAVSVYMYVSFVFLSSNLNTFGSFQTGGTIGFPPTTPPTPASRASETASNDDTPASERASNDDTPFTAPIKRRLGSPN